MNATKLVAVPEGGNALDVLAMRYRAAFERMNGGRDQWLEGTLELGAVITEAVRVYPATQEYNRWLSRHQLEHLSANDRRAIVAVYEMERDNPGTGRKLLEDNFGLALRTIWEKKATKVNSGPLSKRDKGPLSHRSGSSRRKRSAAIPDVMRDDYVPGTRSRAAPPARQRQRAPMQADPPPARPERKGIKLKALTREEVDPDFVGTPLEFATKYGHVNLQTKQQIEHHKNQEQLMAWLGLVSDLDRAARVLAATAVDPETLHQWMSKPAKAEKLRAWCGNIERVGESLRNLCAGGG